MKKVLSSVAVLAALAAGFVLPHRLPRRLRRPPLRSCPGRQDCVTAHLDDALDDLKATDAQRAQIQALKDKLLKDGQALHQGQADAKKALLAQWDSATPDRAAVHALVDARIDAIRAFAHEAADAGLDLHGILTPEQRAQIAKKVQPAHGRARLERAGYDAVRDHRPHAHRAPRRGRRPARRADRRVPRRPRRGGDARRRRAAGLDEALPPPLRRGAPRPHAPGQGRPRGLPGAARPLRRAHRRAHRARRGGRPGDGARARRRRLPRRSPSRRASSWPASGRWSAAPAARPARG